MLGHAHRLVGLVLLLAVAVVCLAGSTPAWAAPPPDRELTVAIKQAPPFTVREGPPEGPAIWKGPSVELWEDVALELGLHFHYHETTLDDMIAGVAEGRYDLAVAALTVTAEREEQVDFTHPYYTTGLAIAVPSRRTSPWANVLGTVFSPEFLRVLLVIGLIQLTVGTLVWLFERRTNPEQFPAGVAKGVATGLWWATVTMATVGYGDKAPKTGLGRLVAMLWMLASMVILASVTATIASSLTVERLESRIRGPEDLPRFRVGAIEATTGDRFLRSQAIAATRYPDVDTAIAALIEGEIEALVWDEPMLRFAIERGPDTWAEQVELVPGVFQRQDYAIAVGEDSPLREAIDRVLPDKIADVQVAPGK
ncbi:transporter substrate-binding domain-containing protein [Nannocystaceae bacterium ST9]